MTLPTSLPVGRSPRRRSRRAATAVVAAVVGAGMAMSSTTAAADDTATVVASTGDAASATRLPYRNPSLPVKQRVADLLSRMTLEEKVGQMTQTERYQVFDDATPITTHALGSILSGGSHHRKRAQARLTGHRLQQPPSTPASASRSSTASTRCTATATCSADVA